MNNFLKWAESKQGMIILGITAVIAIAIYIIRHGSGSVLATPASNGGVTGAVDTSGTPTGPVYTVTTPPVSTPSSPSNPTPTQPSPPTVSGAPIVSNSVVIGTTPGYPNGSTIAAYMGVAGLSKSAACSLNPWLKCGAGYSNGEYDWNNPGNVNGKTFRIA